MLRQNELASTENSGYLHVLPYSSMIIVDLFQHGIRNSLYFASGEWWSRWENLRAKSASFVLETLEEKDLQLAAYRQVLKK